VRAIRAATASSGVRRDGRSVTPSGAKIHTRESASASLVVSWREIRPARTEISDSSELARARNRLSALLDVVRANRTLKP
jgi:hypothetical protein